MDMDMDVDKGLLSNINLIKITTNFRTITSGVEYDTRPTNEHADNATEHAHDAGSGDDGPASTHANLSRSAWVSVI